MFHEYFSNENWIQTMPGIYSCLLHQDKVNEPYPQSLPIQLSSGMVEILFCIRGKITFHQNTGQIDQLGNQSILLFSDCNHLNNAEVDEPIEGVCLCVNSITAKDSLSFLCQAYGNIPITMKQVGQMMQKQKGVCLIPPQVWSLSAFQSLQCLEPKSRAQYCIMKCFELLYLLYMGRTKTNICSEVWEVNHLMQTAETMQSFLIEHLSEKLTIDDLSQHFHLSPTTCKSYFHTYCNQPIHQWVSNKRMEKAAELLIHSTMPIIEIAQSVGYNGCSQFNATFKKKFGKTPSQYRNSVHSR